MKKILLIFTILLINTLSVNASVNYINQCPKVPVQSKITFSKATGISWLTEKIAQSIIKSSLKKETKGKFKVHIQSRSSTDLINGRFNSLEIFGKNLNLDGTHISNLSSQTLCDYNSVQINKDSILFRENMVLKYTIEIDNEAIEQTIIDTGYVATLKKLFPFSDVKVQIKNNKLYFIFEIPTYITKPIKITISSKLNVNNGRIYLSSLHTSNTNYNSRKLISILEKTSPLTFYSGIMDNKDSRVYVDSVKIINNVIVINGLVLLPKNTGN
jgi:hypothetical protein